eukprot:CAMPEP_0113380528 /NCGR_PEP_ID=MMETSP0013_2-20120614/4810_1 /TAXON_ID=2843 ORGANISM="Skeletonema costatum, Strain 1716" /NCGR_SAMPLE_ID=MMETSP0013_2 /ASSEMBLY_ACC=CAM_ASM_000158 /LENGTH=222 /DNA_ID=CAMNT_0000262881 /DNA_START=363 /DNA_END=1031 /DNA_ORIENTATION=- /assembly_acc=CAM_ASM_000158
MKLGLKIKLVRDAAHLQKHYTKDDMPENRCCTSKVQQGEIDPLRAVGGVDYSPILSSKRNLTIFIQGDSLAEQHFLGMICYAWSANNLSVNLERLSAQKDVAQGTVWQANITENDSSFKIQYLRWNQPRYPPSARLGLASTETVDFNLLAKPDFIFLGGWHHGFSDKDSVEQFLAQMSVQGINGHGKQNVFVLDAWSEGLSCALSAHHYHPTTQQKNAPTTS